MSPSCRLTLFLLAALVALTLALAPRAEAYVYWANPGSTENSTGTIGRANLDGTGVDRSFITGAGSPGREDAGGLGVAGLEVTLVRTARWRSLESVVSRGER